MSCAVLEATARRLLRPGMEEGWERLLMRAPTPPAAPLPRPEELLLLLLLLPCGPHSPGTMPAAGKRELPGLFWAAGLAGLALPAAAAAAAAAAEAAAAAACEVEVAPAPQWSSLASRNSEGRALGTGSLGARALRGGCRRVEEG